MELHVLEGLLAFDKLDDHRPRLPLSLFALQRRSVEVALYLLSVRTHQSSAIIHCMKFHNIRGHFTYPPDQRNP